MALTAAASQGFEKHRIHEDGEVYLVPGAAGTTYAEGDLCTMATSGLLTVGTANAAVTLRVTKRTVCPAQTVAFPNAVGNRNLLRSGTDELISALIPVEPLCPVGTKILRATFKDHKDDVVAAYSAASRYIGATTGMSGDDYPNGALLYVYEGPGAGQVNLIEDYDDAGGTVDKMLVLYRPFQVALTTASKFIVLSGEAVATKGLRQFGTIGIADKDEIETDDHANDGKMILMAHWEELPEMMRRLQLPVAPAHLFS